MTRGNLDFDDSTLIQHSVRHSEGNESARTLHPPQVNSGAD